MNVQVKTYMKKKYILFFLCSFLLSGLSAQTLEQARTMFSKGQYKEAKPIFKKQVQSQPGNANYSFWYGVCCQQTGESDEAVKYLEVAVKKRVAGAQLYLGQAYNDTYRYEDAVSCYEEYIAELSRRKRPTEEVEKLLEKSKANLRMVKGVEEVCVIDSFVVNKNDFLSTYKLSEESGSLFSYNAYFQTEGKHPGSVYETEIGNKIYYGEANAGGKLRIMSSNKQLNEWSAGRPLPENINAAGNVNYPYVLTDGVTIYYATDSEGLGGYDIFVTRYNTNTDTYLTPENVGMPFNSPFNDYMYVIDEYNNLGWFASDRYQPEGKVCVYVFIPNSSKQTYNYEAIDPQKMIRLAKLHALRETWKNKNEVAEAQQRLAEAINHKPQERKSVDFEFVIDDRTTYNFLQDFKSKEARLLFQKYQQNRKDFEQQKDRLEELRNSYIKANKAEKDRIAPTILEIEKQMLQMNENLDTLEINVRNLEKTNSK